MVVAIVPFLRHVVKPYFSILKLAGSRSLGVLVFSRLVDLGFTVKLTDREHMFVLCSVVVLSGLQLWNIGHFQGCVYKRFLKSLDRLSSYQHLPWMESSWGLPWDVQSAKMPNFRFQVGHFDLPKLAWFWLDFWLFMLAAPHGSHKVWHSSFLAL